MPFVSHPVGSRWSSPSVGTGHHPCTRSSSSPAGGSDELSMIRAINMGASARWLREGRHFSLRGHPGAGTTPVLVGGMAATASWPAVSSATGRSTLEALIWLSRSSTRGKRTSSGTVIDTGSRSHRFAHARRKPGHTIARAAEVSCPGGVMRAWCERRRDDCCAMGACVAWTGSPVAGRTSAVGPCAPQPTMLVGAVRIADEKRPADMRAGVLIASPQAPEWRRSCLRHLPREPPAAAPRPCPCRYGHERRHGDR